MPNTVGGTIVSVRSATDITIRLATGDELVVQLDASALRARYGPIYGLDIGGAVEVAMDSPPRIVGIEGPH